MPSNVALTGLARDLEARADAGKPVTVGVIGAGQMGADLVSQIAHMRGIRVGALVARTPSRGHDAVRIAYGDAKEGRDVATPEAAHQALEQGALPIVEDAQVALNSPQIDVIVDATGIPSVGAEIGMATIEHGKHLVMMNVEADVTIGAYLRAEAERKGVVYTVGAGDEPSSCMELIEFVSALGLPVISAGKGKNNPLNVDATPDLYEAEAERRNMNPRMLVEFVDGSKTMVEMAAIANATGLTPDIPGMHGPAAGPDELASTLIPRDDGGVLSAPGRVDYSIGKGVAPGVFVVTKTDHPRLHERFSDLKMGPGPYFALMRPFHLTSLEVPLSCARAVLYGKADMQPLKRPVAEVCAVAKRDLQPGESFDLIGQYMYRSWVMTADAAAAAGATPCGMLAGGKVLAPVKKGELLTRANAAPAAGSKLVELRARQDAMLRAAP
ncbi:MAG: homoserine dehydrogenase [Neomegalonema sp.]|nr:homoserine dehydrogenase [Neomegalonema sp.]